jgi:hypothetical protein
MIQRIQSLYLSLTFILSALFLKGSFLTFINENGSLINIRFTGIFKDSTEQGTELIQKVPPVSVLIILIALLSLITIFFFKKLNIQKKLSAIVIILISGFILTLIYYAWILISTLNADLVPGFRMVVPVVMLILTVLANRGIRKDDNLIKSYDRLR